MTTELRRTRWMLWALTVVFLALAWFAGPLIWALGIVSLILAVRCEWVIHQGRRLKV